MAGGRGLAGVGSPVRAGVDTGIGPGVGNQGTARGLGPNREGVALRPCLGGTL